jgi:hypothetical protein
MDIKNRLMEWLLSLFDWLMDRWSAGFWSSYHGAKHPQIRAKSDHS